MKMVFLGPPGAGKGTIAALVKDYYGIPHISTGDLFRMNIKNETPLGLKIKSIIAAGGLVPDSVTIDLVRDRLAQSDCAKGFILDGFPRTIPQADALATMTDLDAVIDLQVSEAMVVRRISGRRLCPSTGRSYHIEFNPPKKAGFDDETGEALIQREDDREESVRHRLEVYRTQTEPLIAYYREKGLIVEIDGEPEKQVVFDSVVKSLSGK